MGRAKGICGPFKYVSDDGFEAWGYRFPSGFIIVEWIPESIPPDERIGGHHQSIYHSWGDFIQVNDGDVVWGEHP